MRVGGASLYKNEKKHPKRLRGPIHTKGKLYNSAGCWVEGGATSCCAVLVSRGARGARRLEMVRGHDDNDTHLFIVIERRVVLLQGLHVAVIITHFSLFFPSFSPFFLLLSPPRQCPIRFLRQRASEVVKRATRCALGCAGARHPRTTTKTREQTLRVRCNREHRRGVSAPDGGEARRQKSPLPSEEPLFYTV